MPDSASASSAVDSAASTSASSAASVFAPHAHRPHTMTGDVQTIIADLINWYNNHFSIEEVVIFALCLVAGVVFSIVLRRILGNRLRSWVGKKDPVLGDRIARAMTAPLWIFICSYFFVLGLEQLSGLPRSAQKRLDDLAPVIYLVAGFVFAFRCMDIVTEVLRRRWAGDEKTLDEQWAKMIGGLGKVLVVLMGVLMILPKDRILPLLTGASFLGAGFALASKSTIENIIGSFEIMVDRLFHEGDRISFQNYDGFVTRVGMRSVQITSLTGERITLPNKAFVDQQIHNHTQKGKVLTTIEIGLVYSHSRADMERAMAVLREILDAHPKSEAKVVRFKGFGPSSLDLSITFLGDYKTGAEGADLVSDINLAIKQRFDEEKLEMAFPTSTVYMKNETAPKPETKAA
ncbi:Mechanosensitive ion channel [Verrucomicrobium sp. GAS474]|uniref:mechanosensitive ion channel family protein n=1 Tax=Verrucomicrobium sp. GAS474 TaxID=1882831 RepID=UPI00087B59F5|nr:mechanosensitive ion channel domain-containing protein [Verrucomicrobium sp. GAS474]SDU11270.1 Mechanosensitive ion channel [Verrucomicrobium sp. GAS474]